MIQTINIAIIFYFSQIPSFANISGLSRSYAANAIEAYDSIIVATVIIMLASFLSIGVLVTVYSQAKVVTQSKGSRKPKAYFQFWAFQVFATSFVIYTAIQNSHIEPHIFYITLIPIIVYGTLCGFFITKCDIETPTHFCKCCQGYCHCIVLWMSLCSSLWIITVALFSIPTIILVYYLYPARTLLRLPLLTNAVLYINSLLALLLFQCERLCFLCVKNCKLRKKTCQDVIGCRSDAHYSWGDDVDLCYICNNLRLVEDQPLEERALTHHEFYSSFYDKELRKNYLKVVTYICSPFGTVIILVILILFVIIIHDLTDLHLSSVKDLNLNLLLTLAPTLLLLFVSWYKFDIFYDLKDDEEESKKEILKEILKQEKRILEKIHKAFGNGSIQTTRPDRESYQMNELALDTEYTSDTLQAPGGTAQEIRPEENATRDTFATESDITPATEDEATGGAVSGETIPLLIVNSKPDDYKTLT